MRGAALLRGRAFSTCGVRLARGELFAGVQRHQPGADPTRDAIAELPPGPPPGTVIPINILKEGKDPVVKEDSEYPDWLFRIGVEDKLTVEEMLSKGLKNLTYTEARQLFRTTRRDNIRKHNAAHRKVK
jgi:hypothetical protein